MGEPCPCGSGRAYVACCGPLHDGEPAATAEALMRSRYSAYVLGHTDHVFRTWHPRTRPDDVSSDGTTWLGLEIVRTEDGAPVPRSCTRSAGSSGAADGGCTSTGTCREAADALHRTPRAARLA